MQAKPAHRDLYNYGLAEGDREKQLWFDLQLTDHFANWKGKLIIQWPAPEIVWCRWANANTFAIDAILAESILGGELSDWRELVLTWDELQLIPQRWKNLLSQWRGVYLIWDSRDGKGYVGSAYGDDGIYGRWVNYAKSGHGGNKFLKSRTPDTFHFNILEWAAPDMHEREIIERESGWKVRLHTRAPHGLNDN